MPKEVGTKEKFETIDKYNMASVVFVKVRVRGKYTDEELFDFVGCNDKYMMPEKEHVIDGVATVTYLDD